MEITQKIQGIIKEFGLTGDILSCEHIVNGHINNTYLIKTSDDKKFMVQKINKYVFKNPEAIMHNIDRVTHHIRKKIREEGGDPERGTLRFLRRENGKNYYENGDGSFWRISVYVDKCTAYNSVSNPKMLFSAGYSFGKFQRMLSDFPMDQLYITIITDLR